MCDRPSSLKSLNGSVIEPAPAWAELADLTPARVALGRSGVSLPTRELLSFGLAHARARDAVHTALDTAQLRAVLEAQAWRVIEVASSAPDRAAYLARPDWGRRLSAASEARLIQCVAMESNDIPARPDLVLVLSDGLSSAALHAHALPLLTALRSRLDGLRVAPLVIATQARVALSDAVGEHFGARLAVNLIGERPGLSSPDSLGVYVTAAPRVGRCDAERWCLSNIHGAGLGYKEAAAQLAVLIASALRSGRSGVASMARDASLSASEGVPTSLSLGD